MSSFEWTFRIPRASNKRSFRIVGCTWRLGGRILLTALAGLVQTPLDLLCRSRGLLDAAELVHYLVQLMMVAVTLGRCLVGVVEVAAARENWENIRKQMRKYGVKRLLIRVLMYRRL